MKIFAVILLYSLVSLGYSAECPELDCSGSPPCEFGHHVDVDRCETCECRQEQCQSIQCAKGRVCKVFPLTATMESIARCVDPSMSAQCQLPMDAGPCRARKPMWFYDSDADMCFDFIYGGCRGNENNFKSRIDCEQACRPDSLGVKPGCSPIMCLMYCEHGFEQDEKGCDTCKCRDSPPNNKVQGFNVDACSKTEKCELFCDNGYKFDDAGCEVCECKPPATCPRTECGDQPECPYGRALTEEGCETCTCRSEDVCKNIQCTMYCEYGRIKDRFGCDVCQCKVNPCMFTDCPDNTVCKARNTTEGYRPQCVMADAWDGLCPDFVCMMYCQHGFKKDKYSCDVCECLAETPPSCAMPKCVPCEFGYAVTEYGCMTCECLENPCERYKCSENHVCESTRECYGSTCHYTPRCIVKDKVERVHVRVEFVHEPLDEIELDSLAKHLGEQYSTLLDAEEITIQSVQIIEHDEVTVRADFHLVPVEEVSSTDIVMISQTFKEKIVRHDEGSALRYKETDFIPQHETYTAEYSSNRNIPQPHIDATQEGGDSGSVVVVAACIGGAVVLIVIIVVAVAIIKTKQKQKQVSSPRKKNYIYKPTANNYNEGIEA